MVSLSRKVSIAVASVIAVLSPMAVGEDKPTASSKKPQVYAKSSQKTFVGPRSYFTGEVQVTLTFPPNETAHYSGASVSFAPGARTAWHSHPAGQHMIITSGAGLSGTRNGDTFFFKAGDALWCPPNIDHWHGALPGTEMTHFVVTGSENGKNVEWKERVTDSTYQSHVMKK